jgi:hypothetical protein
MTPVFWVLRAGLLALMRASITAAGGAMRVASRCGRRFRRRRARILNVTDARLLKDMGISPDVVGEIFCEPCARGDDIRLTFPPTDRPTRHHF